MLRGKHLGGESQKFHFAPKGGAADAESRRALGDAPAGFDQGFFDAETRELLEDGFRGGEYPIILRGFQQ